MLTPDFDRQIQTGGELTVMCRYVEADGDTLNQHVSFGMILFKKCQMRRVPGPRLVYRLAVGRDYAHGRLMMKQREMADVGS